jgi:hypothetical protein
MIEGRTENHLHLKLAAKNGEAFYPLFQKGVSLRVRVGCSIREFLSSHLGLPAQEIERRIQTVFLDGRVVDDLDQAFLKDGSTLALSSAMPGLVGATFRRKGILGPFRSSISIQEGKGPPSGKEGSIVLKVFNLLLEELVPPFLEQGVWLEKEDWRDFGERVSPEFWTSLQEGTINGRKASLEEIRNPRFPAEGSVIFLTVLFFQ